MTNFANKAERARRAFQLNPVAAGCAVLLSLMAGQAFAQEATPPAQEQQAAPAAAPADEAANKENEAAVVVVTGIRQGIEKAISIKKNSSSIVEAISAEDIGKLPDTTVSESLSRLPGISVQRNRSSGKAADVSVRGLSPAFNGTLLNGREMASTGFARSPEFDLFPAELMASAVVYKTPDASVIGQGLAATIDLRTAQPLDFGKRVIAANYKKSRLGVGTELPEGDGDRYSLSYIDQFADRTIGLALGFTSYEEEGGAQRKTNSWGGWTPTMAYNGQQVKTPGGFGYDTETSGSNRDGAFATLQFKPNKNFRSTVDLFYSKGGWNQKKTGIEGAVGGNDGTAGGYDPTGELINATIVDGVAVSGTITNFKGVIRNHIERSEDDLKTLGWNNELKVGEWTTSADLTWSKGTKLSSRYETIAGLPGNVDAAALDQITWTGFNGGSFTDLKYSTKLNYADRNLVKLTDVMGWSGGESSPQAGYVALPYIVDKVTALRLAAKKDVAWGPIVATTYGLNRSNRDKSRTGDEGRLMIKGGDPYGAVGIPGSDVAYAGSSSIQVASWDPSGSLGSIYELAPKVDADILNKFWDVKERVTTAYFMGDLEGEMFGLPYRGNVGAQLVHTDQVGSGYSVDTAKCGNTPQTCPAIRTSDGLSYTDFLPSLNLSFSLSNEQVVRLGVAKVLSRPSLDQMRDSQSFVVKNTGEDEILVGGGGNPKLEPFRATALDLSYEKYFGNKGYVSVAGFYKKLDTYIFDAPRFYDFAPYVTPTTPLPDDNGKYHGSTVGLLIEPTNGKGGSIHGYEIAVNVPFSMFTSYLDGFGVMVNHSDTKSGIELPKSGFPNVNTSMERIPLPGLSRKVTNARVYYEAHGIQVAAAARKRSDFLGQVTDFQDNQQLVFIKGDTIVDLQASYEFQSGYLKGLSVYAQASNWTEEPFQEYTTDRNSITNKVEYGRTYHFGMNYKF